MSCWRAALVMATLLGMWKPVLNCYPESRELHICINIYLERDYPSIEAFLSPKPRGSRGRVIIEGPDLENVCRKVLELEDCFKELVFQCQTYDQMFQFDRMLYGLHSTYLFLCNSPDFKTQNLKNLLINGACIQHVRKTLADCEEHDFVNLWKQVLRLQADKKICEPIKQHVQCLVERLQTSQCAPEAAQVYNNTMNTWLYAWCRGTAKTSSSVLLVTLLIIWAIVFIM